MSENPSYTIVPHAGIDFAVEDRGEGPPLVLLHGLTATRRYVLHGSTSLERSGRRTVAIDARGHGDTTPAPDGKYSYELLADDVRGVMDALDIEKPVIAGVSMGSATAFRFALACPERVAGLVIITPAHRGRPSTETNLDRWDALSQGLRNGGVDGFLDAYGTPKAPEKARGAIETMLRQRMARHRYPEGVADALSRVPRSAAFDGLESLADITVPTLIVASQDTMDAEHPLAVAEDCARVMPNARLIVEEPGESPLAWRGGTLSKAIAEFLASEGL